MGTQNITIIVRAKDRASKEFQKVTKSSQKMGKAIVASGAVAAAAITAIGVASINLAREQIRVEKQLDQVIKSTGSAAGLTADELKRMARELQRVSNFGDETIISAQNMLLTFTKIGKEVFPQALKATLNIATAMNVGLKEASIQVGKALNDPILGITALTRVGITFTDQQKEMIKSLAESGQVMQAQTVILNELTTQFGGSAEAQRDPLIQLKNAIGDLGEEIGFVLLPAVNRLSDEAIPIVEEFGDTVEDVGKVGIFDALKEDAFLLGFAILEATGGASEGFRTVTQDIVDANDALTDLDEDVREFFKIPGIGILPGFAGAQTAGAPGVIPPTTGELLSQFDIAEAQRKATEDFAKSDLVVTPEERIELAGLDTKVEDILAQLRERGISGSQARIQVNQIEMTINAPGGSADEIADASERSTVEALQSIDNG
jgi:hypothetical protein